MFIPLYIFPVPISTYITAKNKLEEQYAGDFIDEIRIVASYCFKYL